MFTFYTKYFKLCSKYSQYRFKAKHFNLKFNIFKKFLILREVGKLGYFTQFGGKIILKWVTIWHPQFFFSLAEVLEKLGKFAISTDK